MKEENTRNAITPANPFHLMEKRKPVALLLRAIEEEDQTIASCDQAVIDMIREKEKSAKRRGELLAAIGAIDNLPGIQQTNAKWAELAAAGAVAINGIDRILQAIQPDGAWVTEAITGIRRVIEEYRRGRKDPHGDTKE